MPSSRRWAALAAIRWYTGGSRVPAIGISTGIEPAVRILRDRVHQASFSTLGWNEACHGVAPGEAGHPHPRQCRAENYALVNHATA